MIRRPTGDIPADEIHDWGSSLEQAWTRGRVYRGAPAGTLVRQPGGEVGTYFAYSPLVLDGGAAPRQGSRRFAIGTGICCLLIVVLACAQVSGRWPRWPSTARAWIAGHLPEAAKQQLQRAWQQSSSLVQQSSPLRGRSLALPGGPGGACCEADTAACFACRLGLSTQSYCTAWPHSEAPGCEGAGGGPGAAGVLANGAGAACCAERRAECLACSAGLPVEDFCRSLEEPEALSGCPVQRPPGRASHCCSVRTAECLSCSLGLTIAEFCLDERHADVIGCAGFCGLMEQGLTYPGEDLRVVRFLPSPDACCALCRAESNCTAWTWQRRPDSPDYGRCHLKRQDELRRQQDIDYLSGLPGEAASLFRLEGAAGMCVAHGEDVVFHRCDGIPAGALWTFDFLTHRVKAGGSVCLTAIPDGADMQAALRHCESRNPLQRWEYDSASRQMRSPSGCLSSRSAGPAAAPVLVLEPCDDRHEQRWVLRSAKAAALLPQSPWLAPELRLTTRPPATSTFTTTSAPQPSLFCFMVMLPTGYEPALVQLQHSLTIGIFACDGWSVYTNADVNLAGFVPTKLPIGLHSELHGVFHTYYNTQIFINIWQQVTSEARFTGFSFTVKADPDAVLIPSVLRRKLDVYSADGRLERAEQQSGMFINNCKFGLHGPVEILSKRALATYASGWPHCTRPPQEDVFMQTCLTSLGVLRQDDFAVLVEDHCAPPAGWNDCRGDYAVFHPFKTVEGYKRCFDKAASLGA